MFGGIKPASVSRSNIAFADRACGIDRDDSP
jgi:hypothetical protein